MKQKFFTVMTVCLTTVSTFLIFACKEDGDTTLPTISLIEPADGDTLLIGGEHGIHFEAAFSDNDALASYKVNIHPNFDGHTHTRSSASTGEFEFNQSWDLSGQRNADVHHHEIRIPANATPGAYHLIVYCTDAAGNESHIAIGVELSHDVEEDVE